MAAHNVAILSPANHEAKVEDNHDGTYQIVMRFLTSGGGLNYFPIKFQMYFVLGEGDDGGPEHCPTC